MKGLKSLKPDIVITGKVPQNYLNIDNIDEDNTLFADDDKGNVVNSALPINNVQSEKNISEEDTKLKN